MDGLDIALFSSLLKDKRMFRSANAAHFALQIPAIRHDFKVLAFSGTEAISTLYCIHIELVSEHPGFDLESLLSQVAFLQFGHNGEGIHGRIEDVLVGEAGRYQLDIDLLQFRGLGCILAGQLERVVGRHDAELGPGCAVNNPDFRGTNAIVNARTEVATGLESLVGLAANGGYPPLGGQGRGGQGV